MVTGYNPGCVFAPGKPLILHTKNHIYTNFNTLKKSSHPVALGFTCFQLLPFFGNLSYQKQVEKWCEATSINQKRNAPLLYGNF